MVAMNIVLAAINLFFIARMLRERGDEQAYAVLPVREDDAYLNHFLGVHRADIDRVLPRLRRRRGRGRSAYLVQHGDETGGRDRRARRGRRHGAGRARLRDTAVP